MKRKMSNDRGKRYDEEFRRRAVEMLIHSGKTQTQVARELGVSNFSLNRWKKMAQGEMKSEVVDGKELTPKEAFEEIRRLNRENGYLRRQREILKKAMSILGEESAPGMR